jgi:ubiquitin carboxyl-terminal hydrolase 34
MSTRHHILSHETPLEEIFPHTRPWRTLYSIHVLSSHLHECNKLGVADQAFILHGARVLSDLLLDSSRPSSGPVLLKCLPGLVGFLQGEINQPKMTTGLRVANDPTERPQDSPPPPYVQQPKKLGLRLFEIIEQIESIAPATSLAMLQPATLSTRADLMRLTYSVILQLARTDELWPEIDHSSVFIGAHKTLLLNEDVSVSQAMSAIMADFAKEKPELATRSYLNTLVALLPDAMRRRCTTTGYFTLFREIIMIDRRANDKDESIRSIIEKLVQHVWQHRHTETADTAIMDPTWYNLLSLLSCAIDVLKSFKQPLALGNLARNIYSRLLFCEGAHTGEAVLPTKVADEPSRASLTLRASSNQPAPNIASPELGRPIPDHSISDHDTPTPLYHVSSRAVCMDIVRKLCDNASDFVWLMDRVDSVTQNVTPWLVGTFPNGHYIRAPEASPGLTNLGMTCYMNSLLQQIYSNIQFRKFIFDTPVADPTEPNLLWHVKRLFAEMQDSNVPCVDTQALAKYLNISVDTQEDVHGFFTIFMSALEQCLPSSAATATFNGMFSGRLVTQVQGSCGHVSSRTEPFSDLSITVQNKLSLADSLEEFVQGEPMQGANKYKCLSCDAESGGKLVDAMRRTCLDSVPDHLTVCLKRFTFDMMGQESKNNDLFQFPEEIDVAKYKRESLESTSEPTQPDVFKLVGVIVHSGILNFGHYWSYVRLRYPDHRISRWARLEDSMYRPAKGFDEVRNECFGGNNRAHNGYVLFYQRESAFKTAASTILPQDVQLGLNMPPRVQIPSDLYREIHQQNIERHCTAQPFDESFHRLVMEIMSDFRSRCEPSDFEDCPSPQFPDADSTGDDQMADLARPQTHVTLARLALNYISRVLLSEKVPQKVNHITFIIKNQVAVDTKLARCFIAEICGNPEVILRFIDHDEADSRINIKIMLRDCLASLKEQDQDNYFALLARFVSAHASLLSQMGPRHGRWFDYFSMAFDLKLFGADEASVVLNAGYISWILETAIDAPYHPLAHPDEQALVIAARKGKVQWQPLFHFVQLFLVQSGAFEAPDCFDEFTPGGRFRAAQALVTPREAILDWVPLASLSDCEESNWEQYPPAVLIHAMASSPDTRCRPLLCHSLSASFQRNSHYKPALYHIATAFILACGDDRDGLTQNVINAMVDGIKQFERMPCKAGLDVFTAIYPFAPLSTLRAVGSCTPDWLLPENRNSRRTHNWLHWSLFGDDVLHKVSDSPEVWGTPVDVTRSRSVRELYNRCRGVLAHAHEVDEGAAYVNMQASMSDADKYLGNLITMCNEIKLQTRRILQAYTESTAEDQLAGITAPGLADVPELSPQMNEEYALAVRVRQDLHRLLQHLSSWDEEQEQVEEEGDSSAFEDTEEDDY